MTLLQRYIKNTMLAFRSSVLPIGYFRAKERIWMDGGSGFRAEVARMFGYLEAFGSGYDRFMRPTDKGVKFINLVQREYTDTLRRISREQDL